MWCSQTREIISSQISLPKDKGSGLALLKTAPAVYRLLKAITDFGILPDRLDAMLQLLGMLLKKPSDELRWSVQFKALAPVISPGLASENRATQQLAVECRDLFLKMGFAEFLNL